MQEIYAIQKFYYQNLLPSMSPSQITDLISAKKAKPDSVSNTTNKAK